MPENDYIFSTLGQIPGMPAQIPPQYLGASGSLRRFPLSQAQMVQPDLQNLGLGGAALPAQIGAQMLANYLAQRSGMMMTPAGGSQSNYMRSMRQRQEMMQLQKLSNPADMSRIRSVVSAFTNAAYRGEDPTKVGRLTDSVTRDYMQLLDTGVGQMLGLEDYLAPGGLSSSFAQRMYQAGMGRRVAPGRVGIGVQETMDITKALRQRMFRTGAQGQMIENTSFTRGLNTREFGEMAIEMSQRGILDISKNKDRMMKQFGDMAGAVDALKDLMGTPDAPIPEIMQTLDEMFGGNGLRSIPVAKLETMVRTAEQYGRVLGLTSQTMGQVLKNASLQARGLGVNGELGALSAFRAMPYAAGAQQLADEELAGPSGGRIRLGMLSPEERMQKTQELVLRANNSDFSYRLAALSKMRRDAGGQLRGGADVTRVNKILADISAGRTPSNADMAWAYRALPLGGYERIAREAGFDEQTIMRQLEDKRSLQEEMANTNMTPVTMGALRAQTIEQLGANVAGSSLISNALGLTKMGTGAERAAAAQNFVVSMLNAGRGPEGLRTALRQNKQIQANMASIIATAGRAGHVITPEQVYNSIETQMRSMSSTLAKEYFGERTLEELQGRFSDRGMARAAEAQRVAEIQAASDESMARAGFGKARGGLGGMFQNFLRAVAENPSEGMEALAARTLGGIPRGELLATMSAEGPLYGKVKEMQEKTARLASINKDITTATGESKEKLLTQRSRLEDELAALVEGLRDLKEFLRPGEQQAAAEHGALSLRMRDAAERGDVGAMTQLLSEQAKVNIPETLAGATQLNKQQMDRYAALYGEAQRISNEALTATGPDKLEKVRAAAIRIAEIQEQLGAIRKEAGSPSAESIVGDIEKKRLEHDKAIKEEAAGTKAEQVKQEAMAAEATKSPAAVDVDNPRESRKIPDAQMVEQKTMKVKNSTNNTVEEWTKHVIVQ